MNLYLSSKINNRVTCPYCGYAQDLKAIEKYFDLNLVDYLTDNNLDELETEWVCENCKKYFELDFCIEFDPEITIYGVRK